MTRDRRERLADLFEAVRALPPDRRSAYLQAHCGDDPVLREEVRSLVAAAEAANESLDEMAERLVARAAGGVIVAADDEAVAMLIGHTVGRYEVRELLGRGGMGVVFRAFDPSLGRDVALKFLPPRLHGTAAEERLRKEARAVSRLDHPNVAVVHEIGTAEAALGPPWSGRLYVAMGYYPGETLAKKIAAGPLPVARALDYAAQLAAGLERAHEAGIVHRDVTPANAIVTTRGTVKLIDFGVARVVGTEGGREVATVGTVAYMSPEQVDGAHVDRRTDLWSLGVVLYEMLTGRRPFEGEDGPAVMRAIREEEPEDLRAARPDLPDDVVAIVTRCLRKDPSKRPADAAELGAELHSAAVPDRRARGGRRLGAALAAVAVVVAGLLLRDAAPGESGAPSAYEIDPTGIAVLPFSPSVPDSALERLGRDLVITLSATLDGLGGVTTADPQTVLGQVGTLGESGLTRDGGRSLAAGLGVGQALVGWLTRVGSDVRVEAELLDASGDATLARITAVGPGTDIAPLTDTLSLRLVRRLWRENPPVAPGLAAVTTRSVPALRAYLEGERALARRDMEGAVASFERAFQADSTFWFAYWRSFYPRSYREVSEPPDSAITRGILEHADEFPVRERLLVEAWHERSLRGRLDRLRALTDRFGFYAPAWFSYANSLVHFGPYVGTTLEDARIAMERAAALNPDFAPAWDHLFWIALSQNDVGRADAALREVERTMAPTGSGATWLSVERFRRAMLHGPPPPDSLARTMDWVLSLPPDVRVTIATGFVAEYRPVHQLAFNERLLDRDPADDVKAAVWLGNAQAWLARGSWRAALRDLDRYARLVPGNGLGPRRAYGVAVAGVVLGVLPLDEALRRRPEGPLATAWSAEASAELAWLDGLLAYARSDHAGLDDARDRLGASHAASSDILRESLDAFAADAAGDRRLAARLLVDRERRTGDQWEFTELSSFAPLLIPLDRMLAARWLAALGRDEEAEPLLTFPDAIGTSEGEAWRRSLGVTALLERARLAESAGRTTDARRLYALFAQTFDRPDPGLEGLRAQAQAGLVRLTAR